LKALRTSSNRRHLPPITRRAKVAWRLNSASPLTSKPS
jgi:hypothetical protein